MSEPPPPRAETEAGPPPARLSQEDCARLRAQLARAVARVCPPWLSAQADGDGNLDLTVQFDRLDVRRMLVREHTLDVLATWKFTDQSSGRASARVRFVVGDVE